MLPANKIVSTPKQKLSLLKKIVVAALSAISLAALAGAVYQQVGSRLDARRSPEPGKLVDVGGRRLELYCTGQLQAPGAPTVILESGLGDFLEEWQPRIQPAIAKFTRVCSYDRAGYGESDAGPMPRISSRIAADLHALLAAAGEKPPYVLLGHSFGGYIVRVFNGRYPNEVAGMVLVDSVQEDEYDELPWTSASRPGYAADGLRHYETQARWAPLWMGLGIGRLQYRKELGPEAYLILQSKYLKARANEMENIQQSAAEARASGTLGDKPLIVLTAGKIDSSLNALPPADLQRFRTVWPELQARLARLSAHGKQVIVPDAAHNIPGDRPDAVVAAVREVCEAIR